MAAYNRCLQICFIIIQIVFIGLGLALIGVGAWLEVEEGILVDAVNQQAFLVGPYLLIAVGVAIVMVAVVGMIGAMCDRVINRVLLYIYIVVVFIIFVVEIIGAVLAFFYRDQAIDFIGSGLTSTISQYNESAQGISAQGIREAWDFVQSNLDCCGVNNSTDWGIVNLGIPDSCCNVNTTCATTQHINGCSSAVLELVQSQLVVVAAVAIAFLVGEIVVILLAFCLVCCTDFDKE